MRGRGRGRGANRGFEQASRGSVISSNGARTSTRNWDRPPEARRPGANVGKDVKQGDRSDLQWLPSVSRSSGLEPNGDALRSFETQEEYWKYIVEKVEHLELPNRAPSKNMTDRQEREANAMILMRKLREGFVATKRVDNFAIQTVEKSTYLALLYGSPINIASSFGYLLDTYSSSSSSSNQHAIGLLRFVHTLLDEFPSQRASHRLLLPENSIHLPPSSPEWTIASEISSAARRNNWWSLDKLTSTQRLDERLTHEPWSTSKSDKQGNTFDALPRRALLHLVHAVRLKVRDSTWPVLRSAYREVADGPWLEQSLMLSQAAGGAVTELAEFMRLGVERGEAGVKHTPGTRVWVLRRPA